MKIAKYLILAVIASIILFKGLLPYFDPPSMNELSNSAELQIQLMQLLGMTLLLAIIIFFAVAIGKMKWHGN